MHSSLSTVAGLASSFHCCANALMPISMHRHSRLKRSPRLRLGLRRCDYENPPSNLDASVKCVIFRRCHFIHMCCDLRCRRQEMMYIWKFCIIVSCSLGLSRPLKQTGAPGGGWDYFSVGQIQIGKESLDPVDHFMHPFTNRSHFPCWNCRYMTPERKVMKPYDPAADVIQQCEFFHLWQMKR